MQLPAVNTVAFIIALTAFFTVQFNLKGNRALGAAFVVALIFALSSLLGSPVDLKTIVNVVLDTALLTISAAGGYNLVMKIASKVGNS
mgnify:FL=1